MPTFDITSPDGRKFRVNAPEGASQADVLAYAQQNMPKAETFDPTEGMSGYDKFMAGAGKAMVDTYRGIKQLTGLASQQEIDEAKRLDAPLMNTGAGISGNVIGNLATMVGPAAGLGAVGKAAKLPMLVNAARAAVLPETVAGAAASGAAFGGLQPVASDDSRLLNMATGGAGGALGTAIPKVIGKVVAPNISPEVKTLLDAGVTPRPGQILGGAAQRLEEGATSVPIVGDAIKASGRRAVEEFDRAAMNRALAPIGESVPRDMVGHEAVTYTGEKLSKAYNELLPKLTIQLDQEFATGLAGMRDAVNALPEKQAKQFGSIVNQALDKFTPEGAMPGQTMKEVDSKLGTYVRAYKGSADPDQRNLAYALRDVQDGLRAMVARSNPEQAPLLKAIDTGFANFVRVEDAASRIGAKEGLFSPAQLRGAVRAQDKSVRKGAFARGDALMQDLADAGEKVLGQKVPDSGTPFRTANIAAGLTGAYLSPHLLGGAGLMAALYSKPGQEALAALLVKRPQIAGLLRPAIDAGSPYLAAPGSSLLLSQ